MQLGSTLSMTVNDSPEVGHRITPSPFSTPKATPLMGRQNLDDVKRGNMHSKSSAIESGSYKRPILAIRTVSPLAQQRNDTISLTPSPVTMRHNLDPIPKICSSLHDMQLRNDIPPVGGYRWKGKAKTEDLFQHGTQEETRRKRNEPVFSSKIRDILEWRTMRLGTGVYVERKDNGDHGSAKDTKIAAGAMRDLWKGRRMKPPKNKGPKAGQTYEIVNRHIIEDSIDRTVTISTWRERVDGGHRSDTDNMSIYYISPDGYAHDGAYAAEVHEKFERRLPGSKHKSGRENQGTAYGPVVEADSGSSSTLTKDRANYKGYRHAQYDDTGSTTTDPLRQRTLSASNKTRPRAKEDVDRGNPSPWSYLGKIKTQDGPSIQRQRHYQESTPIEKQLPPAPFHPTCSGSTISSIQSASTADLENFLKDCKPSLGRVSGILKSLGIYKLEHLKAVAKLSPETRDREVKEDALRLGMTIMEWAILVDKITR